MKVEAGRRDDARVGHDERDHPNVLDDMGAVGLPAATGGGVVETVVGVLDLEGRRIILDREIGRIVRVPASHERLVQPAGTRDVTVQYADVRTIGAAFPKL